MSCLPMINKWKRLENKCSYNNMLCDSKLLDGCLIGSAPGSCQKVFEA